LASSEGILASFIETADGTILSVNEMEGVEERETIIALKGVNS
jgi:hypothetical protein